MNSKQMSIEEYEQIWRDTNAELKARRVNSELTRYDMMWNRIFNAKIRKLKGTRT